MHEVEQSPEYSGQEIPLNNDDEETSDSSGINSCDEDEGIDSEPIMVFLDTITSDNAIHSLSSYLNQICVTFKINDKRSILMNTDTGGDTFILTTDDLQRLEISVDIKPCSSILIMEEIPYKIWGILRIFKQLSRTPLYPQSVP